MKLGCLLGLGLVGCGTSGEPIKGDVAVQYGGDAPRLVVGSAVADKNTPGKMLVQLGSDNVDCSTYLDNFLSFSNPSGTFVYFSEDLATPGTDTSAAVSVMKSDGSHTSINESTGMVTIATIDTRVTGSVMFTTTADTVGTITVTGSFDVKRCF